MRGVVVPGLVPVTGDVGPDPDHPLEIGTEMLACGEGLVPGPHHGNGLVPDPLLVGDPVPDLQHVGGPVPDLQHVKDLVLDHQDEGGLVPDLQYVEGRVPDHHVIPGAETIAQGLDLIHHADEGPRSPRRRDRRRGDSMERGGRDRDRSPPRRRSPSLTPEPSPPPPPRKSSK